MNAAVSLWIAANVPADPCDMPGSLPDPPVGPTVDDLVSALDAQANTDMSAAVDVTVGGHTGKRFVMTYAQNPTCYGDIPLVMWTAPNGDYRAIQPGIGEDDRRPRYRWPATRDRRGLRSGRHRGRDHRQRRDRLHGVRRPLTHGRILPA